MFRASTGNFFRLTYSFLCCVCLLMSPPKAVFSTMTVISRISSWILESQCLHMLSICSWLVSTFFQIKFFVTESRSRSDCRRIADCLDGVLLCCLVSCACSRCLPSSGVILLEARRGVWSESRWGASHLELAVCSSALVSLFTVSRCLCLCLPHCLPLGFPEISCVEFEGHWVIISYYCGALLRCCVGPM